MNPDLDHTSCGNTITRLAAALKTAYDRIDQLEHELATVAGPTMINQVEQYLADKAGEA